MLPYRPGRLLIQLPYQTISDRRLTKLAPLYIWIHQALLHSVPALLNRTDIYTWIPQLLAFGLRQQSLIQ